MRWVIVFLAVLGIIAASLALREHYRTEASPCAIDDKWDCGVVNKSQFAVFAGVPVAAIGIAGYFLLGLLALIRWRALLLSAALVALIFSLYLTYIEAYTLQIWCIYCVASLTVISCMTLLSVISMFSGWMKIKSRPRSE
ncbi:MAG TPA: vitamin K epoxide reductase family protein [Verrucomicrobiae bacterium]|nr:vitamin K epoxide reductase family protein [Verrucomicrobiae bacterium]